MFRYKKISYFSTMCFVALSVFSCSGCSLHLPIIFLEFWLLNLLSVYHKTSDIHFRMENCRTTFFFYQVGTLFKNLLILSLEYSIIFGPYFETWVNFREYSFTLIHHLWRLMRPSTQASPNSRGNNLSRNVDLNDSHSIGPARTSLPPFHWSYHTWATSLCW